jgi:hypothetical protein
LLASSAVDIWLFPMGDVTVGMATKIGLLGRFVWVLPLVGRALGWSAGLYFFWMRGRVRSARGGY